MTRALTTRTAGGIRRLVAASGLSNLADGVFLVGLQVVTLGVSREPGDLAAVTMAGRLPWLLAALPAGSLADRLDRRRTMVAVNVVRAVLVGGLALAVLHRAESVALLCLVSFAVGVAETLFDTAAQSMPPRLVGRDDLGRVNSRLYAVEHGANQLAGPALGGVLATAAPAAALAAGAAGHLAAAVTLAGLAGSFRAERAGPRARLDRDIVQGARYLLGHPLLRSLAVVTGLANLAVTAVGTALPLYAIDPGPMGLSPSGYGAVLATGALGVIAGSAVVPPLERRLGRRRALVASLVVIGLVGVPALTASPVVVAAAYVVVGTGVMAWNVGTVSLRQRLVPDELLGRVNAGYRVMAWGTMPLGALLAGVVGTALGLRAVFAVAVVICLSGLPLLHRALRDPTVIE